MNKETRDKRGRGPKIRDSRLIVMFHVVESCL